MNFLLSTLWTQCWLAFMISEHSRNWTGWSQFALHKLSLFIHSISQFSSFAVSQFCNSAIEPPEAGSACIHDLWAFQKLNRLKPIRPSFSFSQHFHNSAVGLHSWSLSIPEIEQAKANSPFILFISTFSQFSSSAVFATSFEPPAIRLFYNTQYRRRALRLCFMNFQLYELF